MSFKSSIAPVEIPGHRVLSRDRDRDRDRGMALYALLVTLASSVFVVSLATSFQGSATSRDLVRASLSRACLEAAESSFAQVTSDIRVSLNQGIASPGAGVDFGAVIFDSTSSLPRMLATMNPNGVETLTGDETHRMSQTHRMSLSPVEIVMVSRIDSRQLPFDDAPVRIQGVLELRVAAVGARGRVEAKHQIRQRYSYYVLYDPRGLNVPLLRSNVDAVPLERAHADIFLAAVPIGTVIR